MKRREVLSALALAGTYAAVGAKPHKKGHCIMCGVNLSKMPINEKGWRHIHLHKLPQDTDAKKIKTYGPFCVANKYECSDKYHAQYLMDNLGGSGV